MKVIKKDGTFEDYDFMKIKNAVTKSAKRVMIDLDDEAFDRFKDIVELRLSLLNTELIPIADMHNVVEESLEQFDPRIAKSYKDYRNYKKDFVHMMDKVYQKSQSIRFIGDKENANTDSTLVATKRCLIFNDLNKRLYRKFFMTQEELQACKDGYIYVHDQSARLDTMNCCLCDVGSVMKGGFEMGNIWYNEPKTLDTAFDVLGDIILSTASQQYGGFTVPEVDKILSPYAVKSFKKYVDHAVFGLTSEAGEVAGILQKVYQGHEFDKEHIKKELGDCLWMIAEACEALDLDMDDVMQTNIDKLKARYPEGFSADRSLHRKEGDI